VNTKIRVLLFQIIFLHYFFLISLIKLVAKFRKIDLALNGPKCTFALTIAKKICKMLLDPKSFYQLLAEQIKIERMKKDVSQQNLADHLDLSRTSIMNIETGRHKPSLFQVLQIANYLNIDYTTLIPYKFKKPGTSPANTKVKVNKGLTDDGKVTELDKSSQTAINKFLSNLK